MAKPKSPKSKGQQKKPKDILNATRRVMFEVDWHDLEEAINKHYGKDYEFVPDIECGNDSSHDFRVDGKVNQYDQERLDEFKETGDYNFLAGTLLNDLCRQGLIEPGDYLVQVCW